LQAFWEFGDRAALAQIRLCLNHTLILPPVAEFRSLAWFCVCWAVKFRTLGSLIFAKKRIGAALFYLTLFGGALKTRVRIRRLLERFYPNLRVYLNREQPLCLAFRLRGGFCLGLTHPVVCKFASSRQ